MGGRVCRFRGVDLTASVSRRIGGAPRQPCSPVISRATLLEASVEHLVWRAASRIVPVFLACLYVTAACALTPPSDRDPRYNSSINPKYNSSINPSYNSSINPKYNSSANPAYNSSINPQYNSSLNPAHNSSLDPTKTTWSGLYAFDLDGDVVGVTVRAERGFLAFFNLNGIWQGYFASNSESGYNWFSVVGEWRGSSFIIRHEGLIFSPRMENGSAF